jgi:hypothetical protein
MNLKTFAFLGISFLAGCYVVSEKPANNATQPTQPAQPTAAPAATTTAPATTAAPTATAAQPRRAPTLRTGPAPAVQQANEGTGGAAGTETGTGGTATQSQ